MHNELKRLERDFGWRPDALSKTVGPLTTFSHESQSDSAYDAQHTLERAKLDEASWWYQTRNAIILAQVRRAGICGAIWDVGCGTGVVARELRRNGFEVIGVEPSPTGAQLMADSEFQTFCGALSQLRLPTASIAAVTLFDVLEHIEDRLALLQEINRVLTEDGKLILTVPALQALWSSFDVSERHQLRYSRRKLHAELDAAGFKVLRSGFFFVATVIPLYILRALPYRIGLQRSLSDSAAVAARGGIIGKVVAIVERSLALRVPIGSSLMAVAVKVDRSID